MKNLKPKLFGMSSYNVIQLLKDENKPIIVIDPKGELKKPERTR